MTQLSLETADILWQDGLPYAKKYADGYYSRDDGLAESAHVFIQGNDLIQRWQHWTAQRPFVIAETGFGTGLNCLLAWQQFEQYAPASARLHLLSLDKQPLSNADLRRALAKWTRLDAYSARLIACYPEPTLGCHRLHLAGDRVVLDLWFGEAVDVLREWTSLHQGLVDAWFLDGFAPAKNRSMWQPKVYQQIARLSRPRASLATFTAAGQVRRDLQAAGFSVYKRAGFGRKREMLCAYWAVPRLQPRQNPPWFALPKPTQHRHALIIGGGLAGTATAKTLTQSGWQCTLLEQHSHLALGASAVPQAVAYPVLNAGWDAASRFYLAAYRHLLAFLAATPTLKYNACGLLLAEQAHKPQHWAKVQAALNLPDSIARYLSPKHASQILGQKLDTAALFLPQAVHLNPADLVRTYWQLAEATGRADCQLNCRVQSMKYDAGHWQLQTNQGIFKSETVIVANAHAATHFLPHLPLSPLAGQVSLVKQQQPINSILCGQAHITPAIAGWHTVGSTYQTDSEPQVSQAAHQSNAQAMQSCLNDWSMDTRQYLGWAGVRCSSPDPLAINWRSRRHTKLSTTIR